MDPNRKPLFTHSLMGKHRLLRILVITIVIVSLFFLPALNIHTVKTETFKLVRVNTNVVKHVRMTLLRCRWVIVILQLFSF